jgi:purine-binding chemotaxis protein CheW
VTNRRGEILSLIDCRAFLGLQQPYQIDSGRLLVVRTAGDVVTTGLLVDQVNRILDLATDQVRPPAAPIETKIAPYLRGVTEHNDELLVVLDLESLLLSPEVQQFEPV